MENPALSPPSVYFQDVPQDMLSHHSIAITGYTPFSVVGPRQHMRHTHQPVVGVGQCLLQHAHTPTQIREPNSKCMDRILAAHRYFILAPDAVQPP